MTGFFKGTSFALLVLGLIGGLGYYATKNLGMGKQKQVQRLGTVVRADLVQKISFAGIITSRRRSIITAPYSGYVKNLYVVVGKNVAKGEPLVSVTASLDSFEAVHPLRAPFSGLVTLIRKAEGEFVKENDGSDYILRIDDVSKYFVEAKIAEMDRTKISVGQAAVIKVSAVSNESLKGVVKRVSLAPDEKQQGFNFGGKAQVEYPLYIEITDDNDKIKPGMSAIIDVIAASAEKVLVLGHEYVQGESDNYFVVRKDGSKQDIKVGLKNDEVVEVTAGLAEGDEVEQAEFAK